MIKGPGENGRKNIGDEEKKMIPKGQRFETANELGVVDANSFVGIRIRQVSENEARRIVDEARFHLIGFK